VSQLASWFNAYCLVRTVSNSLEALAAAAALYHLRSYQEAPDAAAARQHVSIAAAAAALGVVIRPTSLLFWLLPGMSHYDPHPHTLCTQHAVCSLYVQDKQSRYCNTSDYTAAVQGGW
jgi:hypothetical protein